MHPVDIVGLSRDRIPHIAMERTPECDSRKRGRGRPTKTWRKTLNKIRQNWKYIGVMPKQL